MLISPIYNAWQSVDSAPKNGTHIALFTKAGSLVRGLERLPSRLLERSRIAMSAISEPKEGVK